MYLWFFIAPIDRLISAIQAVGRFNSFAALGFSFDASRSTIQLAKYRGQGYLNVFPKSVNTWGMDIEELHALVYKGR